MFFGAQTTLALANRFDSIEAGACSTLAEAPVVRTLILCGTESGDFHAMLELRRLRQLIAGLAGLAVEMPRSRAAE